MKAVLCCIVIHSLSLATTAWAADIAQGRAGAWYAGVEVGPSFISDTDVEEFITPVSGVEFQFDPGVRFNFQGGYRFNDFLAIGGETGFTANGIDDVDGFPSVDVNNSSLSQVPLMAHVMLQYPTRSGLIPYVGGAVGVSFSTLYADDMFGNTGTENFILDGSDSDATFAYQGMAGLRFRFNPQMEAGLGYEYLAVEESRWEVDTFESTGGGFIFESNQDIELDSLAVHSIMFTFTMRF